MSFSTPRPYRSVNERSGTRIAALGIEDLFRRGERSMYLQQDDAVVIHGRRVLQLDGSPLVVSDSFADVWGHSLLAPEQHAGKCLLRNTGIFVTPFFFSALFCQVSLHLFSSVHLGTSASAAPRRACSLSHWKIWCFSLVCWFSVSSSLR